MYYKRIKYIMKEWKLMLYILSPSFALYNSLKCEHYNNKNRKNINRKLANLMKFLYFSLSVWIFIIFSFYDLNDRILQRNKIFKFSDLIFTLIVIIIPIIALEISVKGFVKNFNCINRYIRKEGKFRYYLLKNTPLIYLIIGITSMFLICMYGKVIKIQHFVSIIIIFFYGISRPIHFFIVFIPDIIKKIESNHQRDGVGVIRLILLTVGSYINIILDYTILFYMLYLNNIDTFTNKITNILDMFYYTSGCGTILPNNFLVKFYIIIIKFSIVILITGNLGLYMNIKK